MTEAANLALKAIAIDDQLPDAHATLGSVKALHDWNWMGADREFQRALALSPSHSWVRTSYAYCYLLPKQRGQEAVDLLREAVRLDPLSLAVNYMLAHVLYATRQHDQAILQCATTIDLEPTFARAHALMAVSLALAGSYGEAVRHADKAVKLTDREYFIPNWATAAAVFALAGQPDRAKAMLETIAARSRRGRASKYWAALANANLGKPAEVVPLLKEAFRAREPWLRIARLRTPCRPASG
jgi:serine/threonine-protein kinase